MRIHRHHYVFLLLFTIILLHHHHFLSEANPNYPAILNQPEDPPNTKDAVSSFQPSLAVVLGVLSIMFSLTFVLLLYARCCNRRNYQTASASRRRPVFNSLSADESIRSNRSPGVDKKLIKSLPVFRFGSLRGSKDGLECSVCLARFEEIEILRLLPKCKHAFHIDCVDKWLEKNSTCPLCRRKITAEDVAAYDHSNNHNNQSLFTTNSSTDRQQSTGSRIDGDGIIIIDDQNPHSVSVLNPADSNLSSLELYVEREAEEDHFNNNRGVSRSSSSLVNLGSSLRRILGTGGVTTSTTAFAERQKKTMEQISSAARVVDDRSRGRTTALHKHNHKIVISDVVIKNRWSNVSSSDLMFLNSEMLSARFYAGTSTDQQQYSLPPPTTAATDELDRREEFQRIKEEIGRKKLLELRTAAASELMKGRDSNASTTQLLTAGDSTHVGISEGEDTISPVVVLAGRRSVSEITVFSRFRDFGWKNNYKGRENSAVDGGGVVEEAEQKRKMWFPIARRTVEWFANREKHRMKLNHHPAFNNI